MTTHRTPLRNMGTPWGIDPTTTRTMSTRSTTELHVGPWINEWMNDNNNNNNNNDDDDDDDNNNDNDNDK